MDNALGHFEVFEYDNIRVAFFPPNCTSWKQPCDQGIIAALKKRTKYLYLADVLEYHELDEVLKEHKQAQMGRLPRGVAGVEFGNPAHLLDAANYIKCAWAEIRPLTICNAFKKAEIMEFPEHEGKEIDDKDEEVDNMFAELIQDLASLNVVVTQEEMDAFLNVDNENSVEYANAIIEDVEDLLNSQAVENPNNVTIDNEEAAQVDDEDQATFVGFDNLYGQMLAVEDQLLSKEFENEAGDQYDMTMSSFTKFQNKLWRLTTDVKRRKVARRWQVTLHDAFANHEPS